MSVSGVRAKFIRTSLVLCDVMRYINLLAFACWLFLGCLSTRYSPQLAKPQVENERVLLADSTIFSLDFRLKNTIITYTTDGSEPTRYATKYSSPITVTSASVMLAKAFHAGFLPSETLRLEAIAQGTKIDSIAVPTAQKPYTAQLGKTLRRCRPKFG